MSEKPTHCKNCNHHRLTWRHMSSRVVNGIEIIINVYECIRCNTIDTTAHKAGRK